MVTPERRKTRLPWSWGFWIGIAIVFASRELANAFDARWVLYIGLICGGGLCIRDVFRALRDM